MIDKIMLDIECKKKPTLKYAVALKENKLESELMEEFGTAKFFGLIEVTNDERKKLLNYKIIENLYSKEEHRKGILAAELLVKNKVDILLSSRELHKGGSYYALEDNAIEIRIINVRIRGQIHLTHLS